MRTLLLVAMTLSVSACWPFGWDDDDRPPMARTPVDPPEEPPPSPGDGAPPHISIELPTWPPLGPESSVQITVTDNTKLQSLEIDFLHHTTEFLQGTQDVVAVSGTTLGEGYGTLTLTAFDAFAAHETRWVTNLLVDLSPPEMTLGETIVAASGDLEFWVADAWVLGAVELSVGGSTLVHDFEDGFPATIGNAWDYSLVKFAGSDLPLGTNQADIHLTDAAGNSVSESVTITVDGQAPSLQILAPTTGATVSGLFDVILETSDPEGGPVWMDISVSGTPVATAVGPLATVQLNAADFTPGPHVLEAIAHDEAGNASAPATIALQVQ